MNNPYLPMPDRIPGEDRKKENEDWEEKKERQNEARENWAFLLISTSIIAGVYLFFIKDNPSPDSLIDNFLFLYSGGSFFIGIILHFIAEDDAPHPGSFPWWMW